MRSLTLIAVSILLITGCDPVTPTDEPPEGEPAVEMQLVIRGGQGSFGTGWTAVSGDRLFVSNRNDEIAALSIDGQRVLAGAVGALTQHHLIADGQGGVLALGRVLYSNGYLANLVVTRFSADLAVEWSRRLNLQFGSTDEGLFYPHRLVAGPDHVVVLAGNTPVALDLATGDPLWALDAFAPSDRWYGGVADRTGVTLVGRYSQTDLLVQRVGWDGTMAWRRAASTSENGTTSLYLGTPLGLPGGGILLPYTMREFSSRRGVLRLTASGEITDNWHHVWQTTSNNGSQYSSDAVTMDLALRPDGTVRLRDGGVVSYAASPDGRLVGDQWFRGSVYESDRDYVVVGGSVQYGSLSPACEDYDYQSSLRLNARTAGQVEFQLGPVATSQPAAPPTATDFDGAITALALTAEAAPVPRRCSIGQFD